MSKSSRPNLLGRPERINESAQNAGRNQHADVDVPKATEHRASLSDEQQLHLQLCRRRRRASSSVFVYCKLIFRAVHSAVESLILHAILVNKWVCVTPKVVQRVCNFTYTDDLYSGVASFFRRTRLPDELCELRVMIHQREKIVLDEELGLLKTEQKISVNNQKTNR